MSTLVKILRNVSGTTRNVLNRELLENESYTIPYSQWTKLADHAPTLADIASGLIILNNGEVDLSPSDALLLTKKFEYQAANDIYFDNTGSDYAATTVQEVLAEISVSGDSGFSWTHIPGNKTVVVKENRQMLSYQEIEIASLGELEVNGEVVVIL